MSSILDALRKLEGEKAPQPGSGGKKGDLFQPPSPQGRSGARRWVIGIAAAAIAVFAVTFVLGKRDHAKDSKQATPPQVAGAPERPTPGPRTSLPGDGRRMSAESKVLRESMLARYRSLRERESARVAKRMAKRGEVKPQAGAPAAPVTLQVPEQPPPATVAAAPGQLAPGAPSPASGAAAAPVTPPVPEQAPPATVAAAPGQPIPGTPSPASGAVAPTVTPPVAGSPVAPEAPSVPQAASTAPVAPVASAAVPPVAPAPAAPAPVASPAATQTSPAITATTAGRLAAPAVTAPPAMAIQPTATATGAQPTRTAPVRVASATAVLERPAAKTREADASVHSVPQRIEKGKTPLLLITEVTYHDIPERRSASIQVGGGRPRVVHEGDSVDGFKVNQILAGAVEIEVGGGPVMLDVGESMSLTVSSPDFH